MLEAPFREVPKADSGLWRPASRASFPIDPKGFYLMQRPLGFHKPTPHACTYNGMDSARPRLLLSTILVPF